MAVHRYHSRLRRATAWVAVAGAAVLASAFAIAPAAFADDLEEPDSTTEPTQTPEPTSEPTQTPAPTTEPTEDPAAASPDSTDDPPNERAAAEKADEQANDETEKNVEAQVEPDFGFQKFRVGVRIADGSTIPAGVTTLGSEITIVETGPSVPGGLTTTCNTTLVSGSDPTATFCEDLSPINDNYFARPGSVVTVTQTTVNDGLEIIDGTKTVEPCFGGPDLCTGPTEGDVLLTDAVRDDDDDDDDSDDEDSDDEADDDKSDDGDDKDGVLPDTGGEDPRLLGYGAALMVGGASLLLSTRRRSRGKYVLLD